MGQKPHPRGEQTWDEKVADRIESHDCVKHAAFVRGDVDYIAGQREMHYVDMDVRLDVPTQKRVEREIAESLSMGVPECDADSPTLERIRDWLERDVGVVVGEDWTMRRDDVKAGVIEVEASYDARPGGSDRMR